MSLIEGLLQKNKKVDDPTITSDYFGYFGGIL